jgi:hypothetical protein
MTWRRTRRHPDRPVRVLFGVGGSLIGRRGGLRVPGVPDGRTYQRFPSTPEMDAANTESVRAIPKRRDFSDCFMWALLALSPPRARMRAVRPSRASRGSQVWRSPGTVARVAMARLWDVRTRRSRMTPYFRPGFRR